MHGTLPVGFNDWVWSPCFGSWRRRTGVPNARTPPRRPRIAAAAPKHVTHTGKHARTHAHRRARWDVGGLAAGLAALLHRWRRGPNALAGPLPPASLCHRIAASHDRECWVVHVRPHCLRRVCLRRCATVPSPCCLCYHHRASACCRRVYLRLCVAAVLI